MTTAALQAGVAGRAQAGGAPASVAETRRRRYAPLFLHAPLVLAVAATASLWDDPVLTLRVGGVLVLFIFPIIAWLEAKRSPLLLSPLSFYFLWYTTGLGASALYIADNLTHSRVIRFSVTYLLRDDIARAYLLFLIGGLALHAAMQLVRPLPGEAETPDARRTPFGRLAASGAGLAVMWAIGVASRTSGGLNAVLGSAATIMGRGSLAALCAYALARERGRRDLGFWLVLGFGVTVEFVINLRTGSKAFLMYSFTPVVWLLIWDRGMRRWAIPFGLALSLLYLLIISPVVSASRLDMRTGDSPGDRIVSTFIDGSYRSQDFGDSFDAFLDRQFDPAPLALIVREVDHRGLLGGESLDYLAYAFIPRIVWPEKPAVTRGRWFNLYLLGDTRGDETSVGQTAVGELYWNFGMTGVVLGMAAIGLMISGLWRLHGTTPQRDPIAMLGYMTLVLGMNGLTEAGTVVVTMVFGVVFFVPLLWLTRIFGAPGGERRVRPALSGAGE